jgi:rfaE bifunctional protein nucleotidyltransferase chain/domain
VAAVTVVQCHGTFDLFHYGHLVMLQFARSLGDVLIVTVTSDDFVRSMKGPGRPVFNEHQRCAMLRALACVDDVRLIRAPGSEGAVRSIKPDIYVKGKEYEGRLAEQKLVESFGGKVVFHHDDEASLIHSTNLLPYLKEYADGPSAGD